MGDPSAIDHPSARVLRQDKPKQTTTFAAYESLTSRNQFEQAQILNGRLGLTQAASRLQFRYLALKRQRKWISQFEHLRHSNRKRLCRASTSWVTLIQKRTRPKQQIRSPCSSQDYFRFSKVMATSRWMQEPLVMKLSDKASYHLDRTAVYVFKLQMHSERH